jgi:hypothetical protein
MILGNLNWRVQRLNLAHLGAANRAETGTLIQKLLTIGTLFRHKLPSTTSFTAFYTSRLLLQPRAATTGQPQCGQLEHETKNPP